MDGCTSLVSNIKYLAVTCISNELFFYGMIVIDFWRILRCPLSITFFYDSETESQWIFIFHHFIIGFINISLTT